MASNRTVALKRIEKEMKKLEKCPLEGIGMASIDNNPMKFVINMELMMGPYKGFKVQLLMTMTDEYPIEPPKILIFPRQLINQEYHPLIFDCPNGYKRFCLNLLDNKYDMTSIKEYEGWNPSYSISTLLLQVQNLISNPGLLPSKQKITRLMNSLEWYNKILTIIDDEGEKKIEHTWENPYPKMHYMHTKMNEEKNEIKESEDDIKKSMQIIKDGLTCFILRENYIENNDIILGYPIAQRKWGSWEEELYPIPQLLSYQAYIKLATKTKHTYSLIRQYYKNHNRINGDNNQYCIKWFPIYVDKTQFNKNHETIINSLKAIKNGTEFKTYQIFEILPKILKKTIIGMLNENSKISSAFITCFFHYVLLFKKLCQEYKEEYKKCVDRKIKLITMNDYEVNTNIIQDMDDFLILFFLGNKEINTSEM